MADPGKAGGSKCEYLRNAREHISLGMTLSFEARSISLISSLLRVRPSSICRCEDWCCSHTPKSGRALGRLRAHFGVCECQRAVAQAQLTVKRRRGADLRGDCPPPGHVLLAHEEEERERGASSRRRTYNRPSNFVTLLTRLNLASTRRAKHGVECGRTDIVANRTSKPLIHSKAAAYKLEAHDLHAC
eukprot:5556153-Pleurochrysis_carterae.AAC.1